MKYQSILVALGLSLSTLTLGNDLEEIKEQIIEIAQTNQERIDNFSQVREELEPLVQRFLSENNQSLEERNEGKIGAWQQLWTDDTDDTKPNSFFANIDRSQTFQVVSKEGYFYNVSELETIFGFRITAFLRGTYTPSGVGIDIEFTNLEAKLLGVGDVAKVVNKLENGQERFFSASRFAKFPQGPVGATGFIETVYVDEDFRIDYGYNTSDEIVDLFILRRL